MIIEELNKKTIDLEEIEKYKKRVAGRKIDRPADQFYQSSKIDLVKTRKSTLESCSRPEWITQKVQRRKHRNLSKCLILVRWKVE
jgi:hypothetical protein